MTQFEELLRGSVLGIDNAFRVAQRDLFEETTEAANSVHSVSGGRATLKLAERGASAEGTYYELKLVFGRGDAVTIVFFRIPGRGYPMEAARSQSFFGIVGSSTMILDRPGLRDYYKEMAANPDSELVLRLAIVLREGPKAEAAAQAAE